MWKSLKEFLPSFGKWGWVVVIDYLFGLVGAYQSFTGETTVSKISWGIIFILAFIVPPLIAFNKVRISRDEYKSHLDTRPSICVELRQENNIYYLRVHNTGDQGTFKAQIELSSTDPDVWCLPHYNGFWKYGNKAETLILKGHDDLLKIAELYSSHPPGPISQHLKIWFFDPSVNYAHYVTTSSHWLGATITSPDGNTRPLTKHEYRLRITISARPSLKGDVYQGQYILDIDGLRPDPSFQSNFHKKGSQTLD